MRWWYPIWGEESPPTIWSDRFWTHRTSEEVKQLYRERVPLPREDPPWEPPELDPDWAYERRRVLTWVSGWRSGRRR